MKQRSNLQNLLEKALDSKPDKIAIRTSSSQLSYRELDDFVRRVATGLRGNGVERGNRVAWVLPNCLEAVVTTLACYQIGAIAVPLNYRYVTEEARDVLERTRAALFVFHATRKEVVNPILESNINLTAFCVGDVGSSTHNFEELLNHEPIVEATNVESNHPALILFTSGSTGRPKGVVHSHEGAFCGIDVSRRIFDFNESDVVLVGKPISHAGGLQTQLMPTLQAGGTAVLAMKPTPAEAVSLINTNSVTEYGLLASDLLDFIEYLESNPTELPSLKNSIGSGDSVPEDLHHRFRDLIGRDVMEGAGMTEIGGYYAANPRFGKRKWGSLGLPTPDTELRVIDDAGADCPAGQVGEIVLRTQSATTGYWEDPQATAELHRDGWLHTGDLAQRDEDGYVWFVGRKKLMIVRRGSNIAPAEVEDIIDEHPLIHASVVVGIHDASDGQVPVACVALVGEGDSSAEQTLRDYVADHLAAYKNPAHYLFLDELPRTSTGKFDRHKLLEIAEETFGS
jgi:long-chain acyl-CoA synthetase